MWSGCEGALRQVGILFDRTPRSQIIFPTVREEISFGLSSKAINEEAAQNNGQISRPF